MRKHRKWAVLATVILVVGAMTVTAFAAAYQTPAEIVAGLTGKTVESVTSERADADKTYGQIAADAGKLDEFKAAMLDNKKAILDERVKNGTLTQAQADAILVQIEERMENCDGTGSGRANGTCGAGFGLGRGNNGSAGMGVGGGMGRGMMRGGAGCGQGVCAGTNE